MLPFTIPVFPLPNVVLFPTVSLPLHIFEPRYRQLVTDALDGDRIIGMALLQPGWEGTYEARPPIYPVGCAGLITHAEHLPDGRYSIVLRGLEKFRVVREQGDRAYRIAEVDPIIDPPDSREAVQAARRQLEALLIPQTSGVERTMPASMGDEDLVNALAQYLELEGVEKQALLERDGVLVRCQSLIDLLEMKVLSARHEWRSGGN